MSHPHLSLSDALKIGRVLRAAQHTEKVAFIDDGAVREGIARHIVKSPDNVGFVGSDTDVRDAYLRVTMTTGFERFTLVSELVDRLDTTFFTGLT